MLSLSSPLAHLTGVGPILSKRLARLELHTIQDLLLHLPYRYEDFSKLTPLRELKVGERVTIRGKIQLVKSRRAFKRRLTITEALITDGTATVKAIWFNQPYLAGSLKVGQEVWLAGRLISSSYGLQLEQPVLETIERGGVHTGRLVPFYPLTSNLTPRLLRTLVAKALPFTRYLTDWLPEDVRQSAKLPGLGTAIANLHWPHSLSELELSRRRVAFDELYLIHLRAKLARLERQQNTSPALPFSPRTREFVSHLPWPLTPDQKIAAWEIIQDLGRPQPMLRLLEGDVGSGKTIVAGLAALNAALAGWQTAFLAPTEILANQHFATLSRLFKNWPITIGLLTHGHHQLTGQDKPITAAALKRQTSDGKVSILIGTHALLQASISFPKLGLVIVDEQHRFGVVQRQGLLAGNQVTPHLLSLSATPIPRSLALTIYGDLDLSVLKTMPAGRKPITTSIIPPSEREQTYDLMRREVIKGNRVFIICPLIEESDVLGVRAATAEHERLSREVFPELKLGLLHGKLSTRDKTKVMAEFTSGQTPILVSTSVVEVGVDVPQATVMAIEGAERFGVAQLHQFRGRVGRSDRPSTCWLFTDNQSPRGLARLQALVKFQNGFELAEFDLKSRGPGDLLGQAQSGFLKLRFAELADTNLLNTVRQAVAKTLELDAKLTRWPALKAKISEATFHPE